MSPRPSDYGLPCNGCGWRGSWGTVVIEFEDGGLLYLFDTCPICKRDPDRPKCPELQTYEWVTEAVVT